MITVHKGNAEKPENFRLILTCDQCHVHVKTDVPHPHMRDQDSATTELYLERAREELGQRCPHIQEELERQDKERHPSHQETGSASHRRSSYRDSP